MRFNALILAAFGHFRDLRLDLAGGAPGGLHVIFGENEAGKSTSLRAVKAFLFGIAGTTVDAHTFALNQLCVGAEIEAFGIERTLFRRKQRGATLVDAAMEPVNEDVLTNALTGVDLRSFETRFGLDQDELEKGAQALLGGKEEGLFAASAAGADVRRVLSEFKTEAEGLFAKRGRVRALNQAAERYREALREQSVLVHTPENWLEQEQECERRRVTLRQLEEQRRSDRLEHLELSRLASMLSQLGERGAVRVSLEDVASRLPRQLPLRADAHTARQGFEATLRETEILLSASRAERATLEKERGELVRPERSGLRGRVLRLEPELRNLPERLGSARNARGAIPRLEARQQAALGQVARLLLPVQLDLAGLREAEAGRAPQGLLAELTTAAPSRELQRRLRHGIAEERRLSGELEARREACARIERQLLERAEKPWTSELETRLTRLVWFLREAKDWMLRERLRLERTEEVLRAVTFAAALSRELGVSAKCLDDQSTFPTENDLEAWGRSALEVGVRIAEGNARRLTLESELLVVQQEIQARGGRAAAVSTGALLESRRARDALLLRITPGLDLESSSELRSSLQSSISRADELGDLLRIDAERIAHLGELAVRAAKLEAELVSVSKVIEGSTNELVLLQQGKHWLLELLGAMPETEPGRVQELVGRARRVPELLRQRSQILIAQGELERSSLEQTAAWQSLLELIRRDLEGVDGAPHTLVIHEAQDRIALLTEQRQSAQSAEAVRVAHRREVDETKRAALNLETALVSVRSELSAFSQQLKAAPVSELGANPAEIERLLDAWDDAVVPLTEAKGHEQRISGIARDASDLAAEIRSWASAIGVESGEEDPLVQGDALVRLLSETEDEETHLARTERELSERLEAERVLLQRQAQAERELGLLREVAGVSSNEELRKLEELSDRYRQLSGRLAELETALLEKAAGQPLGDLELQASRTNHAELLARIEELSDRLDRHNEQIHQAENQLRGLEDNLVRFSATQAVEARQAVAVRAEEARRLIRRYLVLRSAYETVTGATSEFAERHATPLTERASEIFRHLTLGRYERLRVDPLERTLHVMEERRVLSVDDLSRGTRAQLYFALRIASLEAHFQKSTPFPVVFDDLFVDFDDERAARALEILGSLSRLTQVLYFTHLGRDVERAVDVVPKGLIFTHFLPQFVGASRDA